MHLLVGGPALAGNVFLANRDWKNLELGPGVGIVFRNKRRNCYTASLSLHCIGKYNCAVCYIEFFSFVCLVLV